MFYHIRFKSGLETFQEADYYAYQKLTQSFVFFKNVEFGTGKFQVRRVYEVAREELLSIADDSSEILL